MRATTDLDFLLYPLATEEEPTCPSCGAPMTIAIRMQRAHAVSNMSRRSEQNRLFGIASPQLIATRTKRSRDESPH
jgi:hypothetical protein